VYRHHDWVRLRARQVGLVFQACNLLPTLTAVQNVEVPMFGVVGNRREREARARYLIERVGLADRATHRSAELSGGEQQRVAVARSLANGPALILADEPTGNLDSDSAREILDLLESCRRDESATLVVATHDALVARRAGRLVAMRDGAIVASEGP
jgi:putative ABC transport system ATP-binding protein